jgi:hypothetical protein
MVDRYTKWLCQKRYSLHGRSLTPLAMNAGAAYWPAVRGGQQAQRYRPGLPTRKEVTEKTNSRTLRLLWDKCFKPCGNCMAGVREDEILSEAFADIESHCCCH